MPPRMLRKVAYGTISDRPTVGRPGDLFVVHSDTVSPRLSIYDGYNRDWVDVKASSLEFLEATTPTAGTALASKGVLLDTSAEIDVWNFTTSHEIGDVLYKYQDHEVTAAEVKALFATPQNITDAPAATEFIVFDGAWIWYDFLVAYGGIAAGEDLTITYDAAGAEVGRCEATGFLDQGADEVRWVPPLAPALATAAGIDGTAQLGLCLEIGMLVAEIITGTSPLKIRTFYHTVPSTLS